MPVAIIHAAFDESGKFKDHDVVSLCGWISPYDFWEAFSAQWAAALEQFGMNELHTAEFMGLHGQYSNLRRRWGQGRERKKDKALTALATVIKKTMSKGVGAGIDAKYYRSMSQKFRDANGDPFYIAFQEVIRQSMKYVLAYSKFYALGQDVKISLIFDQNEDQAEQCLKILNKLKKIHADIRERITGICFCDRRSYAPLQAADFIAYVTKKEIERRIHKSSDVPSKWFASLSARNPQDFPDGLFNARILDDETLEELEHSQSTKS